MLEQWQPAIGNLHSWIKATRHIYEPPPLAYPSCMQKRIVMQKKDVKEIVCSVQNLYPGGAVGHRSNAFTEPKNNRILLNLVSYKEEDHK